jgi:ribosomal protein S18 acetylase RimI-like enzyme
VTESARAEPPADAAKPAYHEPARTYVSAVVLFSLLALGFVIDLSLGGALVHIWGWLLAIVIVVGIDVLGIHAARSMRSLTVTDSELRVGEQSLSRSSIIGFERDVDTALPILGQPHRDGLPRGTPGLAVHLVDGSMLIVPTRRPQRLAQALELSLQVPDVRPATPDDLPGLPEIDRRAETLFRVAGIELPDLPFPLDELHEAKAVFVAGRPAVGFVRVDEVDGLAHIEELAVLPGRMREGIGTALLEAACAWAEGHGYPAVTLITFADVDWNAPFYAARGFVPVEQITPGLAELRDWERAVGLDAVGRRIVMRRELGGDGLRRS